MSNFNNISIKQKFIILFFICTITFIGFGTFTLIGLNNLQNITQNLYNQSSKVSDAAVKGKLNLFEIKGSLKSVILLSNKQDIQTQIDKVTQYELDLQNNLDIIGQNSADSNTKRNLQDANNVFSKWWKPQRDEIIKDVLAGKKADAIVISEGISSDFVDQLELDFNNIYLTSSNGEISLIEESNKLQSSQKITLIVTLVILISMLTLAFAMVIRSILNPINRLKEHMIKITNSGNLEEFEITQKNEISEMAADYNILINKLKSKFWINNNLNSLNDQMDGNLSVKELTQRAINFLARSLDAGSGTFYIKNKKNKLMLNSSFAFTERERLSNAYELGEGIVGQVALEKKPILLKNIRKHGIDLSTEMVVGAEGDTLESIKATAKFIEDNKVVVPRFYILTPIPGTEFFKQMQKENRICNDDIYSYNGTEAVHIPKNMTPEELTSAYWDLYNDVFRIKSIINRTICHEDFFKRPHIYLFYLGVNLYYRYQIKHKITPNII